MQKTYCKFSTTDFTENLGDINGDGLADLVWMSKQDIRGDGFVVSFPGFCVNRGTFENPDWAGSSRAWGILDHNNEHGVGEVAVSTIFDWNRDGLGELIAGDRNVPSNPPLWYAINHPDLFSDQVYQGECEYDGCLHWYFDYYWGPYYDPEMYPKYPVPWNIMLVPTFPENQNHPYFPENPLFPVPGGEPVPLDWCNASPAVADLDYDGDFDIVVGINTSGLGNGLGRIYFCMNPGVDTSKDWEILNTTTFDNPLPLFDNEHVDSLETDYSIAYNRPVPGEVTPMPVCYRQRANPAIGDIDMDGALELIVGTVYGDLQCFKMVDGDYHKWVEVTGSTIFDPDEITVADDWFLNQQQQQNQAGGNTRPSLFDYDYDGDLDLLVSDSGENYNIPNNHNLHLYVNKRSLQFIKVTCLEGCNQMNYMFPMDLPCFAIGLNKFYLEIMEAGDVVTGEFCKARALAIVDVQEE